MNERSLFAKPRPEEHTELWVIRHAQSAWNAQGRYQGQTDVPLSEHGEAQARTLAARLARAGLAAAYSSDLRRAMHTAEIALAGSGLAPLPEPGLREIHVGELGGRLYRDIHHHYPEYLHRLHRDPWGTPRPGGESMHDLARRAGAALRELAQRHAGGRVAVFTHGGVVRVAVGLALSEAVTGPLAQLSVHNTAITRVRLGPQPSLLAFNDAAHLETLEAQVPSGEAAGARRSSGPE